MQKDELKAAIESVLREVAEMQSIPLPPEKLAEDFPLIGSKSLLDSMAFVMLTAGIEQRLSEQEDLTVTVVSEKAMSMRNSPFRTLGSLTDYVYELCLENSTQA